MTTPVVTELVGRRTRFTDAPAEVVEVVRRMLGGLETIEDCTGGASTTVAAVIGGTEGWAFVKAAPCADAESLINDARVLTHLSAIPHVPRVLAEDVVDSGEDDWQVLITSAAPGERVRHPWSDDDLAQVLDALCETREALRTVEPAVAGDNRLEGFFSGWKAIAQDEAHPWHHRAKVWAPAEKALRRACRESRRVVHGDVSADNVLTDGRRVTFVDWAQAAVGPGWVDGALLLGDVIASRQDRDLPPHWKHEALQGADRTLVAATVASLAAFLFSRRDRHTPEHLPWLRSWQAAMAESLTPFVMEATL